MLITEAHKQHCWNFHKAPSYGAGGEKDLLRIIDLINKYDAKSFLDYGCGKGNLIGKLPISVWLYEPALEIDERQPSDIVLVRNVLPHVEPECLDDVLQDIKRLTLKCVVFKIGTVEAPGRLIIKSADEWIDLIKPYFKIKYTNKKHNKFYMTCEP